MILGIRNLGLNHIYTYIMYVYASNYIQEAIISTRIPLKQSLFVIFIPFLTYLERL